MKILSFASGKGGVGKTLIAAALGLAMGRAGLRVLLMDCDAGMRNLDIPLGIDAERSPDFWDLAQGICFPEEAIQNAAPGVDFLAAPMEEDWRDLSKHVLYTVLEDLESRYEYLLLDCPAGLGKGLNFARAVSDEMLLIAIPSESSFRAVRRMIQWGNGQNLSILFNDFGSASLSVQEAAKAFKEVHFAGVIPHSEEAACLAKTGRLSAYREESPFGKSLQMVLKQWLAGAEYPLHRWQLLMESESGVEKGKNRFLRRRHSTGSQWKWRGR